MDYETKKLTLLQGNRAQKNAGSRQFQSGLLKFLGTLIFSVLFIAGTQAACNSGFKISPVNRVECNQTVTFTSNVQGGGLTHSWNFGDGSGLSTAVNPTHAYSIAGTYTVTHTVTGLCGTSFTTAKVVVRCCCSTCKGNLVINGNFGNPICRTGYSSDLSYIPCAAGGSLTGHGHYTETATPNGWGGCFGHDHTPGGGTRVLLIDGPTATEGTKRVWYQTVDVVAGKTYCFTAYVLNATNSNPPPGFQLVADGNVVDQVDTVNVDTSNWVKLCGTFTACKTGSIELSIKMFGRGTAAGNDAEIDDISFADTDPSAPDANFFYSISDSCMPVVFIANYNAGKDTWVFGDGDSSRLDNPTHKYTNLGGTFTVKHIVKDSCGTTTTIKMVYVPPCDTVHHHDKCCSNCGDNLTNNGDFSGITPCFGSYSSDLREVPCSPLGAYLNPGVTETTNAALWNPGWQGKDHTGTPGSRALLIDGATDADKRVWYETVNVMPGKKYCFKAWVKNALNGANPPSFELRIGGLGGLTVAKADSLPYDTGWKQICGTFTPTTPSIELDMVMLKGPFAGNDGMVDDIQLFKSCDSPTMKPVIINGGTGIINDKPADNQRLNAYPIPVKKGELLHISYNTDQDNRGDISIFDVSGKLIYKSNAKFKKGSNDISISTNNLSPGSYFVKTEINGSAETKPIVIIQ